MRRFANHPVYQVLFLVALVTAGCGTPAPPPTATPVPTATVRPTSTPWPTSTPEPPDTGWQPVEPGVELRRLLVQGDYVGERLTIVRLDPAAVCFRVHYDPVAPRLVSGWAERIRPLLVINGGYFSPEGETLGLLVSDGQRWGYVYGDFAGMFAVTVSGEVSVRWLDDRPYDPAEPLAEAVMSFPVLVKPGGVLGFMPGDDEGDAARRTVVAQDMAGRVLLIVAPRGHLSLHELARALVESDLALDVALNLDGGSSTGVWMAGETAGMTDSLVPVPSVIGVTLGPGCEGD